MTNLNGDYWNEIQEHLQEKRCPFCRKDELMMPHEKVCGRCLDNRITAKQKALVAHHKGDIHDALPGTFSLPKTWIIINLKGVGQCAIEPNGRCHS